MQSENLWHKSEQWICLMEKSDVYGPNIYSDTICGNNITGREIKFSNLLKNIKNGDQQPWVLCLKPQANEKVLSSHNFFL